MDVALLILAVFLLFRGERLADYLDALWDEWRRPTPPRDPWEGVVLYDFDHGECGTPIEHARDRRIRRRAYRAGRGFRVK